MRSDRVAFQQEEDSEKMVLYKLVNTDLKRALTFAVVVIPETCILLTLFYVLGRASTFLCHPFFAGEL